jgi:hypothetical protein
VLCHMTPVGKYLSSSPRIIHRVIIITSSDTYTAQASVGDVNKGMTNHKVRSFVYFMVYIHVHIRSRIWNLLIPLYSSLGMEMEAADLLQRCLKMWVVIGSEIQYTYYIFFSFDVCALWPTHNRDYRPLSWAVLLKNFLMM